MNYKENLSRRAIYFLARFIYIEIQLRGIDIMIEPSDWKKKYYEI